MQKSEHRKLIHLAAAAVLLLFLTTTVSASQVYTVSRGDTLWKIAQRFSITTSALQQANGIRNINRIEPGQRIVIPSKDAPQRFILGATAKCIRNEAEVKTREGVVAIITKGTQFTMLARTGDFIRIKLEDGRIGWVPIKTICDQPTRSSVERGSPRRDVVRAALAYRGTRYRRGGMSRGGFDCSGFVAYVYSTKGIKLPHSSRTMFNCGKPVAQSDLREGDLVFFAGTYRRGISHVGIYVGNRQFIHSSSHGRGVRLDSLDQSYYRRKYAGARRL